MNHVLALLAFLFAVIPHKQEQKQFRLAGFTQGTTWSITYYHTDSIVSKGNIDSLLAVVDQSMSIYLPGATINRFNESAKGIKVEQHLVDVVNRAKQICRDTDGLFDITVKPYVDAWGFGIKRPDTLPTEKTLRSYQKCIGSDKLNVKGDQLLKKRSCVQIDVNGIAQGYTVDLISQYLTSRSVKAFLVEIGGEIRTSGLKPSGEKFKVGIESPSEDPFESMLMNKVVTIENGALTTSGNYRRYYESEGKKISHIINPKTGYPESNEIISVTVFASDAITADGYDNALMLMGIEKAFKFLTSRNDLSAYFIYRNSNGTISDTATARFYSLLQQ